MATLLVATPVHAQGVKAGYSASTISFQPDNNSPELSQIERSNGFVGGVSFLIPTNRAGGYQIEVLFHQKGARNLLRLDDHLRHRELRRGRRRRRRASSFATGR